MRIFTFLDTVWVIYDDKALSQCNKCNAERPMQFIINISVNKDAARCFLDDPILRENMIFM